MPKQTTSKDKEVNKWEEQWRLIAPRPEWDNPAYWEACRGIMPARTVEG